MGRKKKTSKFAGKVTSDAKRQKQAESSYGYLKLPKNVNVFSAEPGGRIRVDIIPYVVSDPVHPDRNSELDIAVPGELWYKRPFKVHRNIGVGNDTVVCPTSFGKRCPICEYRAKRLKEGADKEETDPLKAKARNLYVVKPVKSKEHDDKFYIWDVSQYLFQNLLNEELEEQPDNEVFPDLEEGLTLRIRFDSKTIGKSQPFAEASRIDFEERDEIYDESILEEVPDLDKVLNVPSYAELEMKFFELEPEEGAEVKDEEDNVDEVPEPPKRRKKKAEPEPEEEENTPEDAPEEEEEKPRRRKKKPAPEPDPEEDEPDEGDESEPEEKPKRKKKAAAKTDDRCPHGHRFGYDCEKFDECDECEEWDDCIEEQEKLEG